MQDSIFVVEEIRRHRKYKGPGEIQYFVKWRGYPESESTWEPECNFIDTEVIRSYWTQHSATNESKATSVCLSVMEFAVQTGCK